MVRIKTLFQEAQSLLLSLGKSNDRKNTIRILFNWSEILGSDIALYAFPKRITINSKGKTLLVEVSNNVVGTELYYIKNEIISKINLYLGKEIIKDLVFRTKHRAMELKKPRERTKTSQKVYNVNIKGIKDNSLKTSLNSLFNDIKRKHDKTF